MLRQVDQLSGPSHAANGCFRNGFSLSGQRDDAAVVVRIHLPVEDINARERHRFDNGVNFGAVAPFGKVRDTLDQRHGNFRFAICRHSAN